MKALQLFQFGKAFLCSIGATESVVFLWRFLGLPTTTISTTSWLQLGFILSITVIWFCADGFFVTGFLKRRISFPICEGAISLSIEFGDLFKMKGLKVIPVNSFFDSAVNESVVSSSTLHGKMLTLFFAGRTCEFDDQISQSLAQQGIIPVAQCKRLHNTGKTEEYQIGTSAIARTKENDLFLCVALSKTNAQTNHSSASMNDIHTAVGGALAFANIFGNGAPVIFPLLGDGLSRTGLSPIFLLNLMIQSVISANKMEKTTNEICIVLHSSKRWCINLADIKRIWGIT